jgi:hypothetical protein
VESIISAINRHSGHLLVLEISLVFLILVLLIATWLYNRKKYQNLKHQIPATVVKDYLDSIIHNSNALKSSLFRGGGSELEGSPSVVSLKDLTGSTPANAPDLTPLLRQKDEEIAKLKLELSQKAEQPASSNEGQNDELILQLSQAKSRIVELEAMLAQMKSASNTEVGSAGDDSALKAELAKMTQERDELLERLKEYEIIGDDIADLKRLQQENALLKKSLEARGIAIPSGVQGDEAYAETTPRAKPAYEEDEAEVVSTDQDGSDLDQFEQALKQATQEEAIEEVAAVKDQVEEVYENEAPASEPEEQAEVESAQASASEVDDDSEKSPEDLLSEFEKMLG